MESNIVDPVWGWEDDDVARVVLTENQDETSLVQVYLGRRLVSQIDQVTCFEKHKATPGRRLTLTLNDLEAKLRTYRAPASAEDDIFVADDHNERRTR